MEALDRSSFSITSKLFFLLLSLILLDTGSTETQGLEFGATIFKNVLEGDSFKINCNTTSLIAYWENDKGQAFPGRTLTLPKIKRGETGMYTCYNNLVQKKKEELVYINVLYPAKFLSVSATAGPLDVGKPYNIQYKVEGNPAPQTSFTSVARGTVISHHNSSDAYNTTIESVKCTDGGAYTLMTSNSVAKDSREEEILVNCAPSLSTVIFDKDVLEPRLGENITIKVFTTNYPYVNFTWTYKGSELNSTDKNFETELYLPKFELDQFGNYSLSIANDLGETAHTFKVEANGRPDPVQNLTISMVTERSANLSWVSGYDYGAPQNFIIRSVNGTGHEDIDSFDEKSDSHGLRNVSHVVDNLETDAVYTIRVVANNSRGEADKSLASVVFKTGPYENKPVVEGESLFVVCNSTVAGANVYWVNADRSFRSKNGQLAFFNVTRNYTDIYTCMEVANTTITVVETLFVDVQYPAKILSLNVTKNILSANDTYTINITVEGNPTPVTTLKKDGTILFQANKTNNFDLKVDHVTCSLTGTVELTCMNHLYDNSTHVASTEEDVFVKCLPSPKSNVIKTSKPRLGESVTFRMENTGYPYPTYTWMHEGKVLKNITGSKDEDEYTIKGVVVQSFGQYTVIMKNDLGRFIYNFTLQEDGPPEPVTDISVTNIAETTANITFMTGFDYGAKQNFIIQSYDNGTYEDVAVFSDNSTNHKPSRMSHVISKLDFGTTYNLSVISNNSRGEGIRSSAILLTTKVPKENSEVLEGDNVTLTCPESNMTDVHWVDSNGKSVSLNGTLVMVEIKRQASGHYKCKGKMGDINRIFEDVYIDVQYVAKILNLTIDENKLKPNDTYNIDLIVEGNPTPNITFSNVRDGRMIYNENMTGELNITIESVECDDLGTYQLMVSNKRGHETKQEEILVTCQPVVNKRAHIKQEFYPRISEMTAIKIENYGYPYPKYIWMFDQKNLTNHEDSDFQSVLNVNISADDFGDYVVDMENAYGNLDVSFHIIATGPPDPVKNFKVDNFTYNSVTLSWMSGFNYGNPQTFIVKRIQDGKETDFKNISDPSPRGLMTGDYVLTGLDSSTSYNFTVYSVNKNGTSAAPQGSGTIAFQTADAPSKKSHTGAIVGGLIGALVGVVLIVAIAFYLKKRRNKYDTLQ